MEHWILELKRRLLRFMKYTKKKVHDLIKNTLYYQHIKKKLYLRLSWSLVMLKVSNDFTISLKNMKI